MSDRLDVVLGQCEEGMQLMKEHHKSLFDLKVVTLEDEEGHEAREGKTKKYENVFWQYNTVSKVCKHV
jgi:hypothetical protein